MTVTVPDLLRTDAEALTPPVPFEFQGYATVGSDGVQAVGRPGKIGVIDLELKRGATGKTGLSKRYVKAPMSLSRPLHVDPSDDSVAVVYLRSTGGGIAQNDRIRQRFVLQPSAQAVVTTQTATAVHRMNGGFGTQWTSFFIGDSAVLEYLPGHTTLFGGSRLVQLTEFDLAPTAALIAGETVMLGRLASGELHKFDACSITTRVTREGEVLLNDRILAESRHDNANTQLFDRWPIWASLVIVPPAVGSAGSSAAASAGGSADDTSGAAGGGSVHAAAQSIDVKALVDELHELGQQLVAESVAVSSAKPGGEPSTVEDPSTVEYPSTVGIFCSTGAEVRPALAIGASLLAKNSGAMVRIAGHNMDQVRNAMDRIHSAARQRLLGKPSFDLRRM